MHEGEARKREHEVGLVAQFLGVAVAGSDEKTHVLESTHFPLVVEGDQLASGGSFSAFVHDNAHRAFAGF